jgi:hypothetical protein
MDTNRALRAELARDLATGRAQCGQNAVKGASEKDWPTVPVPTPAGPAT